MQVIMENEVFRTTSAATQTAVGTVCKEGGINYLKIDGKNTVTIEGALPVNCKEGDRVAAALAAGKAVVKEVFGPSTECEPNLKALLRREGVDTEFEADAIMQGKETAFTEIRALMAKRTDLRGKTIITLSESESTRNECGFSVERLGDGDYLLGIHTADVVEFATDSSALEKAVHTRCKTAILPGKDIPMLPETITKGPCFLEVGEDRLAVSYFLTIDGEGKVKDFSFCESVIKTAANCLFSEIDALFLDYDISAVIPLRKAYASVLSVISNMFDLGAVLQNARVMRGGADIDKAERHFVYSRHGGKPVGVVFRKESDPKRLIREFLSIAGQTLASYLYNNKLPAIYRVQSAPSAAVLKQFRQLCEAVGVSTDSYEDNRLILNVTEAIRGIREEELILTHLRSILPEVGFSDTPCKHFIHGSDMYTRFAYPLNRCADFCIQQVIKAVLAGKTEGEELADLVCKVQEGVIAAGGEARVNKVESLAETLIALDCLKRDRNKTYTGLVWQIGKDKITLLLDNGCIATLTVDENITVKDDTATIKGSKYSFGSEMTVNYKEADFVNAVLYVEA